MSEKSDEPQPEGPRPTAIEEAREQIESNAKALRAAKVPIETEPPAAYRP